MIVVKIDDVYQVNMPASVRAMLEIFRMVVSFGLGTTNDVLACLGAPRFINRLAVWMVLPAFLVICVLLGCVVHLAIKRRLTRAAVLQAALPWITRALFLL